MPNFSNDLLREAIADAERVRETAIANAKLQLEEELGPAVRREIVRALSEGHNPMVGTKATDFSKVEKASLSSSEVGGGDNRAPAKGASATSHIGADGETSGNDEGETPQIMKEEEGYGDEEHGDAEHGDEDELDLESIILQLQHEVDAMKGGEEGEEEEEDELDMTISPEGEMEVDGEEEMESEPEAEEEPEEEMEEEFDLYAVLREIEAELSEETDVQMAEENARLKSELAEYRKAVELLRGKLNEVNLLNAKLLYTNKLFRNKELTSEQKIHIVETFDMATTLREVKLLFATLSEATVAPRVKKTVSTNKVVTESIASKPVGSTAPKAEVIVENQTSKFRSRMQELAGIKIL